MKILNGEFKIGILGGGQLGKMLIQEAVNYNLSIHVLDPDSNAPCRFLCQKFQKGDFLDYDTVLEFGRNVNLLTIEIEKVNVEALEKLESEGVLVYPQSRVVRLIQDKGLQKQFFKENNIPSADFQLFLGREDLYQSRIPFPAMQKLRRDGYDGKGVMKLHSEADIVNAFDSPSLLEEIVDFKKEISVLVARNTSGEVKAFPAVDMDFNPNVNLVEFLISPSEFSENLLKSAYDLAIKIANSLEIVGLLAVEMFVDQNDNLLVNELAPRPHNSGHHTIEGNYTSQFEQHLRAILGLPLGDTSCIYHSVMVNLLGEKDYEGVAIYDGLAKVLQLKGVFVHLYGKKITKPFRKMGHITVLAETRADAIQKARQVQELVRVRA